MFNANDSTIIAIDIQEKLVNMFSHKESIIENCTKLLKSAKILNIDTILTEQYPKGLGATIEDIKKIKDFKTIEKTTFSALATPEFKEEFNKTKNKNIILFGIETHICVLQTALDLLNRDCNVFVVADCCASRSEYNKTVALDLMKQFGCKIITLEIALFEFLKSSKHPSFKEVQGLIK